MWVKIPIESEETRTKSNETTCGHYVILLLPWRTSVPVVVGVFLLGPVGSD